MKEGNIEITIGDVSDVAARVVARCICAGTAPDDDAAETFTLSGTVRGPFCANARTLPATFEFRSVEDVSENGERNNNYSVVEALIADPCMWSQELPHVYQVDVAARNGDRVVAEYHGQIGLQRTTPRRPYDFSSV